MFHFRLIRSTQLKSLQQDYKKQWKLRWQTHTILPCIILLRKFLATSTNMQTMRILMGPIISKLRGWTTNLAIIAKLRGWTTKYEINAIFTSFSECRISEILWKVFKRLTKVPSVLNEYMKMILLKCICVRMWRVISDHINWIMLNSTVSYRAKQYTFLYWKSRKKRWKT